MLYSLYGYKVPLSMQLNLRFQLCNASGFFFFLTFPKLIRSVGQWETKKKRLGWPNTSLKVFLQIFALRNLLLPENLTF